MIKVGISVIAICLAAFLMIIAVTISAYMYGQDGSPIMGIGTLLIWLGVFVILGFIGIYIYTNTVSTGRRLAFIAIIVLVTLWVHIFYVFKVYPIGLLLICASLLFSIMLIVAVMAKNIWYGILMAVISVWILYQSYVSYKIAKEMQ